MKIFFITLLSLSFGSFSACSGDGAERLRNRTEIETQEQQDQENEQRRIRAEVMERDLATRHLFFQAVQGTYEGTVENSRESYDLRVTLVPSLTPFSGNRVRTEEEIAADIKELKFRMQLLISDPKTGIRLVSCQMQELRPDLKKGTWNVSSDADTCSNLFFFSISERELGVAEDPQTHFEETSGVMAASLAARILASQVQSIPTLAGKMQPSTSSLIYYFTAKRSAE